MKKTLIALTLAALPVASMADVILYGQIKGGIEAKFKEKVGGEKVEGTTTGIVDYGSRIGFKGHEHLNGDLKAIWQLEQKVDIAGGKNTRGFGTRDSFVGLQSDAAGTVKAGYIGSPVFQTNDRLDIWDYSDEALGMGNYTRTSDASKRAVAVSYTTPNMAGFQATAYVSPSDNNVDETEAHNGAKRDSAIYGVGFNYENNGFFADAAGGYVKNGANNNTGRISSHTGNWIKKKEGYQYVAQAGYDNDTVLAGVSYQRAKNVDEDYDVSNEVAASVGYKVNPSLRLKGSAVYGFDIRDQAGEKLNGNGKYYQGLVGADYDLSKRTTVNGQVGYYQAGKKAEKTHKGLVGVGLKHKF